MVQPIDRVSLEEQLEEVDQLEPIRAQWTTAPERFPEGLLAGQLSLLDANDGVCWKLFEPWGDPDYVPTTGDDSDDD